MLKNCSLRLKLIFTILCIIFKEHNTRFCKFFENAYYDYEGIDFPLYGKKITSNMNLTVYGSLCSDSAGKTICDGKNPGNVFYKFERENKCYSLSKASKKKPSGRHWTRQILEDELMQKIINETEKNSLKKTTYSSESDDSEESWMDQSILLSHKIEDSSHFDLDYQSINYAMICNRDITEQKINLISINKDIYFVYQGIDACPYKVIEGTVFLKRHKNFSLILFFLSIITLIMIKYNESISMFVAGIKIGMIVVVNLLANLEHHYHLGDDQIVVFGICFVVIGVIVGALSVCSRETGVLLTGISAALATNYTIYVTYALITSKGVSEVTFWITFLILSLSVFCSTFSRTFINRYALNIYISIDQPFFLVYSLSIFFQFYPEIITIKEARDYGKDKNIEKIKNWIGLFIQILIQIITLILLFRLNMVSKFIRSNPHNNRMPSFSFLKNKRKSSDYHSFLDSNLGGRKAREVEEDKSVGSYLNNF